MRKGHLVVLFFLLVGASVLGAFVFNKWFYVTSEASFKQPLDRYIINTNSSITKDSDINFVRASKKCTPSVVFIKTESQQYRRSSLHCLG